MTRRAVVDAISGFAIGLAVLELASSVVQGVIVLPIEASSDNHTSWSTLSFTIDGRFFTLLGVLQSLLVLAAVTALALWAHRRGVRHVPDPVARSDV